MLSFVLLLFSLACVKAVFPRACIQEFYDGSEKCCPLYNGSPCGVNDGRGDCVERFAMGRSGVDNVEAQPVLNDDRINWPSFYFNTSCQCRGNYGGPNCGQCDYAYEGPSCSIKRNATRKDIMKMTPLERTRYFSAIHYCKSKICEDFVILVAGDRLDSATYHFKNASYYDVVCFAHYYAIKPFLINKFVSYGRNPAHRGPAFLPWHRVLLLFYERQMQLCLNDPGFTPAYYNWTADEGCAVCTNDYVGASDETGKIHPSSVFSKWRMHCGEDDYDYQYCIMGDCECERPRFCRTPGEGPNPRKPTQADVQAFLNIPNYDTSPYDTTSRNSMRNSLEGFSSPDGTRSETSLHNLMHVWLGCTMTLVPISCNDPIFLLHHCYVDYLFNLWVKKYSATPATYPSNSIYGHMPYDCMAPFWPCRQPRTYLIDSAELGYRYSN